MKVKDAMVGTPVSCGPEANLGVAAELLWNQNCGILPVVDSDRKVVGVMTDRDMCIALGTRNLLPGQILVKEVMTGKVHSCQVDDDVHLALEKMSKGRVRRLPVVDSNGVLQGILSMDDVVLHAEGPSRAGATGLTQKDVVETLKTIYRPEVPQVAKSRQSAI
ncbi:MAG TPA: CBS domain-containing protein [Candidatus Acidoferrum sp.]|nr:CBS domain-containing protein [Candidatus Acidoferrum sp.]